MFKPEPPSNTPSLEDGRTPFPFGPLPPNQNYFDRVSLSNLSIAGNLSPNIVSIFRPQTGIICLYSNKKKIAQTKIVLCIPELYTSKQTHTRTNKQTSKQPSKSTHIHPQTHIYLVRKKTGSMVSEDQIEKEKVVQNDCEKGNIVLEFDDQKNQNSKDDLKKDNTQDEEEQHLDKKDSKTRKEEIYEKQNSGNNSDNDNNDSDGNIEICDKQNKFPYVETR